jgi:hypothetical protein
MPQSAQWCAAHITLINKRIKRVSFSSSVGRYQQRRNYLRRVVNLL